MNKRAINRFLSILLIGMVVLVIACGGSASEPQTDSPKATPTAKAVSTSPEVVDEAPVAEEPSPTTQSATEAPTKPSKQTDSKPTIGKTSEATVKPTTKPTTEPSKPSKPASPSKTVVAAPDSPTAEPTATATSIPTPKPTPTPTPTPEPPIFSVSDLSITPTEPGPGDQVSISVLVKNDGKGPGSHDVKLEIGGLLVKTESVTLAAETEKQLLFTVTEETVGTYDVKIETLAATFSVRQGLFLEVVTPANQTVVTTASIEVQGNTLPTSILSINGSLTAVNASGTFTTTLTLEEGVNIIQIVASDLRGNETGEVLTLIYLP
ncbi:uncharacterized protein METZ01_LOCUS204168 [marine metagenome]|uniref:CARDB domain-containing protein n=1 Tax=marine metagenome TaxID=408172 RepID=A0A382EMI1_9ZZZZ